jgi:hypothetical protein
MIGASILMTRANGLSQKVFMNIEEEILEPKK